MKPKTISQINKAAALEQNYRFNVFAKKKKVV